MFGRSWISRYLFHGQHSGSSSLLPEGSTLSGHVALDIETLGWLPRLGASRWHTFNVCQ